MTAPVDFVHIEFLVRSLAAETGIEFRLAYIGNCDSSGRYDDRLWFVGAPHPDRVGKRTDRIGDYRTSELGLLARELAGALQLARIQNRAF